MTKAISQKINGHSAILARDLMTELTAVVNTLGGRKVTVGFSGTGAYCDKSLSYVNIPALPETDFIPIRVAQYIRGFAAHEAAHIAFTDSTVNIVKRDGQEDALQHTIWNCVEDFMIENFWLSIYPGARKNFEATETYACEGYFESLKKFPEQVHDLRIIGGVALTWMRAVAFGLQTPLSIDALNTLPQDHKDRVQNWFWTHVQNVETTQECLEAAWIIYEDIMQNPFSSTTTPDIKKKLDKKASKNKSGNQNGTPQPDQGQPGQQGSGTASQSQSGTGQPAQKGSSPSQGTPGGQGQPANSASSGSQTPGTGSGKPSKDGTPTPNTSKGPGSSTGSPQQDPNAQSATGFGPTPVPYPVSFDLNEALRTNKIAMDDVSYRNIEVLSTSKSGPAAKILSNSAGQKRATLAIQDIRTVISKTASELQRSLKSYAKTRIKTGRIDGDIDPKRIAFFKTGSREFHKKKIKGIAVDTAVTILVDCSVSMNNHEMQICQQMALILENSLSGTPVKHEILGYTTAINPDFPDAYQTTVKANNKRGTNTKFRGISIYEFRKFGESSPLAQATLGNMCHIPKSGTPTAPAILMAHDRLARRKERRHVMFVLTDGESDNSTTTLKAVKAVEACGVTVIGIGIGTTTVRKEFTNHVTISSADELPKLMLSGLSDIILGEKHLKGANALQVKQKRMSST